MWEGSVRRIRTQGTAVGRGSPSGAPVRLEGLGVRVWLGPLAPSVRARPRHRLGSALRAYASRRK